MNEPVNELLLKVLLKYELICFDFDGVIKDSVAVKERCYLETFRRICSDQLSLQQIAVHHNSNGGVSRFEKVPIYLRMCKIEVTESNIRLALEDFAARCVEAVIESPWIPGFLELHDELIDMNKKTAVVSATPQAEMIEICNQLDLSGKLSAIYGAPARKDAAILKLAEKFNLALQSVCLIGDSSSDAQAASNLGIDFIYRAHSSCSSCYPYPSIISVQDYLNHG